MFIIYYWDFQDRFFPLTTKEPWKIAQFAISECLWLVPGTWEE